MTDKINLLIVEDHALTLFGLKTVLNSKDFIKDIFEAQNGAKALSVIKKTPIDIAVVDLGLPDINGIELSRKIREVSPSTKIIILTSHNKQEEVIECFKCGAKAYCSKEIDTNVLGEVIEHVKYGAVWIDPAVSNIVESCLSAENTLNTDKMDNYKFTAREKEILRLLVNGLDNSEMSKRLSVSLHTVKAHMCSILQKMNVKDRTQAAVKAIKMFK